VKTEATRPRDQARQLASEILEKHGATDEAKTRFYTEMGKASFNTIGSAEAVAIWKEAIPKPPPAPEKRFHPPAVLDPEGRDRWQQVRALVDHGIKPQSLADSVLRLIEAGWSREDAIAWGRSEHDVAIRSGSGLREPWIAKATKLVAESRREQS
jgi:hypothetical protein